MKIEDVINRFTFEPAGTSKRILADAYRTGRVHPHAVGCATCHNQSRKGMSCWGCGDQLDRYLPSGFTIEQLLDGRNIDCNGFSVLPEGGY